MCILKREDKKLKISIDEVRTLPNQRLNLSFKELIDGLDAVKPVTGELTLIASSTGMRVCGTVQSMLKRTCDRCLGPYFLSLPVAIDEKFMETPREHIVEQFTREKELTAEDFIECLDADGSLDIVDVVYQAVTLATPISSLCGSECPGPAFPVGKTGSGALVSDNQADQHRDHTDPRWKNLKSLFPNRESDEKS